MTALTNILTQTDISSRHLLNRLGIHRANRHNLTREERDERNFKIVTGIIGAGILLACATYLTLAGYNNYNQSSNKINQSQSINYGGKQ